MPGDIARLLGAWDDAETRAFNEAMSAFTTLPDDAPSYILEDQAKPKPELRAGVSAPDRRPDASPPSTRGPRAPVTAGRLPGRPARRLARQPGEGHGLDEIRIQSVRGGRFDRHARQRAGAGCRSSSGLCTPPPQTSSARAGRRVARAARRRSLRAVNRAQRRLHVGGRSAPLAEALRRSQPHGTGRGRCSWAAAAPARDRPAGAPAMPARPCPSRRRRRRDRSARRGGAGTRHPSGHCPGRCRSRARRRPPAAGSGWRCRRY